MAFFGLFGKERKREDLIRERTQQLTEDYQTALAQKNEKIKEQREAHKGQPWPGMDPINRVSAVMNTPHKMAPVEDPVSEDRKKELGNIIFSPQIGEDDLEDVTTQEILFILNAIDGFQKRTPLENYEENRRTVYEALLGRIRKTAWIYTLYDQAIGYPLLERGAAVIYFDEEHAKQAVNLYRVQLRAANALRLFGEDRESWPQGRRVISAFELFYYLGIERIIVENGWYSAEVRREDLLQCWKWTDKERAEHQAAPALSYAMTEYAEERVWPLRYDGKQQVLKKKFEEVIHQLVPAQLFLIPVQES